MKMLPDKVQEASLALENVPMFPSDDVEGRVKFIWACLAELGVYNDVLSNDLLMSDDCKEGDARVVFCEKNRLPVPRFRRIWSILKEGESKKSDKESASNQSLLKEFSKLVPIGQWSDEELLAKYDKNCVNDVIEELKKRSQGRPCMIYDTETGLLIKEVSLHLLRESRHKNTPSSYNADGKVFRVYCVGEFQNETFTICPVTGDALFNGYCEKLGVTWEFPMEALQFIALVSRSGVNINAITVRDLQKIFKEEGIDGLRKLFPKIAIEFDELKTINSLPNLLRTSSSKGVKDPFGGHKRY